MTDPVPKDCVDKLKLLAEGTRLKVMEILMTGPKQVGEINTVLGIDQSLLSHHLALLREAGLVTACREGKAVRYALAEKVRDREGRRALDLGCCRLDFD